MTKKPDKTLKKAKEKQQGEDAGLWGHVASGITPLPDPTCLDESINQAVDGRIFRFNRNTPSQSPHGSGCDRPDRSKPEALKPLFPSGLPKRLPQVHCTASRCHRHPVKRLGENLPNAA